MEDLPLNMATGRRPRRGGERERPDRSDTGGSDTTRRDERSDDKSKDRDNVKDHGDDTSRDGRPDRSDREDKEGTSTRTRGDERGDGEISTKRRERSDNSSDDSISNANMLDRSLSTNDTSNFIGRWGFVILAWAGYMGYHIFREVA